MPPRKKPKTTLEAEYEVFLEKASAEFVRVKRATSGTITTAKLQAICQKLELSYDPSLLHSDDISEGVSLARFRDIMGQLKKEHDLTNIFDYVYGYLSYGGDQVTFAALAKSLKTLPKQPKSLKVTAEMVELANGTDYRQPITKENFKMLCRYIGFFDKYYKEQNLGLLPFESGATNK